MRSDLDLEPILAVPNGPFKAYCGGGNSPRVNPGLSFLAPSASGPAVWTFGEGITGIKGSWHLLRLTSRLSPGLYPIRANLICKISARRRGHAESPGAGRAKLRLSQGFPRLPACGITPQRSVVRLDDDVHVCTVI
jgi:hypothetical protein